MNLKGFMYKSSVFPDLYWKVGHIGLFREDGSPVILTMNPIPEDQRGVGVRKFKCRKARTDRRSSKE